MNKKIKLILTKEQKEKLLESLENENNFVLLEKEGDDEDNSEDEIDDSLMYSRVQEALDNKYLRIAEIVKDLWGSKDATNRSLFSKKLRQEKNDDGIPYKFEREELTKILSIVGSICSGRGKGKDKTKKGD